MRRELSFFRRPSLLSYVVLSFFSLFLVLYSFFGRLGVPFQRPPETLSSESSPGHLGDPLRLEKGAEASVVVPAVSVQSSERQRPKEISSLIQRAQSSLPLRATFARKSDLSRGGESFSSRAMIAGAEIGNLLAWPRETDEDVVQVQNFLEECAFNERIIDAIRALCLLKIGEIGAGDLLDEGALPRRVKELASLLQ